MSRHLAFLEGKPNEPLEMSEDEDDETGSEINVKVTSSQTKTPPNIVGKTIQFYFERYDKFFFKCIEQGIKLLNRTI